MYTDENPNSPLTREERIFLNLINFDKLDEKGLEGIIEKFYCDLDGVSCIYYNHQILRKDKDDVVIVVEPADESLPLKMMTVRELSKMFPSRVIKIQRSSGVYSEALKLSALDYNIALFFNYDKTGFGKLTYPGNYFFVN